MEGLVRGFCMVVFFGWVANDGLIASMGDEDQGPIGFMSRAGAWHELQWQ